jgi:transposase
MPESTAIKAVSYTTPRGTIRWRDLPERFGRYGTVKQRCYEWVNRGFFQTIFNALNQGCDFEWLCVDATVVRAHPSTCGGRTPEKRGPEAQGLGRSRGGLSTKIHAATDALGNPARLLAGPGQQGDVKRALELIEEIACAYVIADRGYDADYFHDAILDQGATPVIPPMPGRNYQHNYDEELYKNRNSIERFFNKLKNFRRIATRYEALRQTPRQLPRIRHARRYPY